MKNIDIYFLIGFVLGATTITVADLGWYWLIGWVFVCWGINSIAKESLEVGDKE